MSSTPKPNEGRNLEDDWIVIDIDEVNLENGLAEELDTTAGSEQENTNQEHLKKTQAMLSVIMDIFRSKKEEHNYALLQTSECNEENLENSRSCDRPPQEVPGTSKSLEEGNTDDELHKKAETVLQIMRDIFRSKKQVDKYALLETEPNAGTSGTSEGETCARSPPMVNTKNTNVDPEEEQKSGDLSKKGKSVLSILRDLFGMKSDKYTLLEAGREGDFENGSRGRPPKEMFGVDPAEKGEDSSEEGPKKALLSFFWDLFGLEQQKEHNHTDDFIQFDSDGDWGFDFASFTCPDVGFEQLAVLMSYV